MKHLVALLLLAFALFHTSQCRAGKAIKVDVLTCEYLTNPLAVATKSPRLGWRIVTTDATLRDVRQATYRIIVASTKKKLDRGEADLWDSGTVATDASQQVAFDGKIPEGTRWCFWKVRVTDNHGHDSGWSEAAFWGVPPTQWHAEWIGDKPDLKLRDYLRYVADNHGSPSFDRDMWRNPPVPASPMLRKTFSVRGKISRATLHATALGYYEMWINGRRVGRGQLSPEWTDYGDHVQFQTYDVTGLLSGGANAISAVMGDGWALGRLAGVGWMDSYPHRGMYAQDRRLMACLDIEFADGSRIAIPTDGSWKINTDGYIISADNFAGECIDARKIPSGWQFARFDDSAWANVYVDKSVERVIAPQPNEPIVVHTELSPVRIWRRGDKQMVDFGQNIAGHCMLKVKGTRGREITLRHAEWLNADGSLYTQSLNYADATDRFILSGGDDCFDPSMTYHGFQYVEIEGLEAELKPGQIVARAISSDVKPSGEFACSNAELNQLYKNIVWTQRNNMQSVLTDNPSRSERTGAAGDIQLFAQTAMFNMQMGAFFTKFVSDMKVVAPNGQFFSMIPSLRHAGFWDGFIGAPGWCEAGIIVPWRMYENYGDTRALENIFTQMCGHIDATLKENPDLIWRVRHNHNGDWLNANTLSSDVDPTYDTRHGATPDDVFATAYFAYGTRLLADISRVLGRDAEHEKYSALAEKIRRVFIDNYVDADGRVEGQTQGAYSLALYFDLIPEELRPRSFSHLLDCIKAYDNRLSTGFITTPMMMQTLCDFGRTDVAYALLTSTRFPSWLNIVRNGATTVWERWDTWTPTAGFQNPSMNSLDHVAFGAVGEWMYRHILGINPSLSGPGYRRFTIMPEPGGGLTWVKGSYLSVRGTIRSEWRTEGTQTTYRFTIPANSEARVVLPATESSRVISAVADKFGRDASGRFVAFLGSGSYVVTVEQ